MCRFESIPPPSSPAYIHSAQGSHNPELKSAPEATAATHKRTRHWPSQPPHCLAPPSPPVIPHHTLLEPHHRRASLVKHGLGVATAVTHSCGKVRLTPKTPARRGGRHRPQHNHAGPAATTHIKSSGPSGDSPHRQHPHSEAAAHGASTRTHELLLPRPAPTRSDGRPTLDQQPSPPAPVRMGGRPNQQHQHDGSAAAASSTNTVRQPSVSTQSAR